MASNIEERRVQRLGTSSLIVTLPKKWVRKVNLKPGDKVVVLVEDDEVRILPPSKTLPQKEKYLVKLSKIENELLMTEIPLCLYILGLREAIIDAKGLDISTINKVITRASNLLGAKAACLGNNMIEMKVLVDVDEDVISMLRSVFRNLVLLLRTIIGVIENRNKLDELLNDARMLSNEIYKNHYAIARLTYRKSYTLTVDGDHLVQVFVAPSVSQMAHMMSLIALETVQTLSAMDTRKISKLTIELTENLIEVLDKIGNSLRDGDVDVLKEATTTISKLDKEILGKIKKSKDESLYILAKAQDFLKLLDNTASMLACWLTVSSMIKKGILSE